MSVSTEERIAKVTKSDLAVEGIDELISKLNPVLQQLNDIKADAEKLKNDILKKAEDRAEERKRG